MIIEPRPNDESRRALRRDASTPFTIRTSPRPRRILARPAVVSWVARRAPRAVLSLNASARIEPPIVLLLANDLTLPSIRSGFRHFPRVLFCDAATIASRIAWLRSRGLWRQCPQTLTLSEERLERKRVFEETIAPTLSVENLLAKLDEVQGALGVPRRELAALAARMPGLLEAAAVLRAVPRLLVSDIDACYSPAGFSSSDAALLIRRRPTLHRFSVAKYYSPLVMFLSRQGIHGPALVRVLRLAPELLGHSIESLRRIPRVLPPAPASPPLRPEPSGASARGCCSSRGAACARPSVG
eukprot:tig00020629_g12435.t1